LIVHCFFLLSKKNSGYCILGKKCKIEKKKMIHGFKTMQEIGVSEKAIF